MSSVAAIVLAAGGSTRLGLPKQLAHFDGRTLVRRACDTALNVGADPVLVVLGAAAEGCALELRGMPLTVVLNPQWHTGMAGSIRAALDALEEMETSPSAALICLCDQPKISSETLRAMIQMHTSGGAQIVASEYGGTLGAPALFAAKHFADLRALRGEQGARRLFQLFPDSVTAFPHPTAEFDVDTTADYDRLTRAIKDSRFADLARSP